MVNELRPVPMTPELRAELILALLGYHPWQRATRNEYLDHPMVRQAREC